MNGSLYNILLADDDEIIREMGLFCLSRFGYHISLAEDMADAIRRSEEQPFDLVIADLHMPHVDDGFHLIEHLRGTPHYRDTPIIVMTTESSAERKQRAKDLGVAAWIVKPFRPKGLMDTVERVLKIDEVNGSRNNEKDRMASGHPTFDLSCVICRHETQAISKIQTSLLERIEGCDVKDPRVKQQLELYDVLATRMHLKKVKQKHEHCSFPHCRNQKILHDIRREVCQTGHTPDINRLTNLVKGLSE